MLEHDSAPVTTPHAALYEMQQRYSDYLQAAEAVCRHLSAENTVLMHGDGALMLKDHRIAARKSWLIANHSVTAKRIAEALASGYPALEEISEHMVTMIAKVRSLMERNRHLLLTTIHSRKHAIDQIMQRIDAVCAADIDQPISASPNKGADYVTH